MAKFFYSWIATSTTWTDLKFTEATTNRRAICGPWSMDYWKVKTSTRQRKFKKRNPESTEELTVALQDEVLRIQSVYAGLRFRQSQSYWRPRFYQRRAQIVGVAARQFVWDSRRRHRSTPKSPSRMTWLKSELCPSPDIAQTYAPCVSVRTKLPWHRPVVNRWRFGIEALKIVSEQWRVITL